MKELLGLKVQLFTNGDITIIDGPVDNTRECFGPTYGSQHPVIGVITDVKIQTTFSHKWLENPEIEDKYEIEIRIGVTFNHPREGKYTGHWSLSPEHINYLLNKEVE